MNQSKIESLIEAVVNTCIGFVITITFLPIVNKICGIQMSGSQMGISTLLFTIISVLRGFVIRRFFNNLHWLKTKLKSWFIKEESYINY
jgi:hypothetical protein